MIDRLFELEKSLIEQKKKVIPETKEQPKNIFQMIFSNKNETPP